jgi:Tfp pilus assembly protein FimT
MRDECPDGERGRPLSPSLPNDRCAVLISEHGFTIIELVLILLVVALIGVAATLDLSSFSSVTVDGAARKLSAHLRYVQQLAVTKHTRHGVVFNADLVGTPAPNTYTAFMVNAPAPSTPARDPSGGGALLVNYNTDPQLQGATITGSNFCGAPCGNTVEFDALGVPTDPGGVPLTADGTVILNYAGNTRTVTITQSTGTVTVGP